MALPLVLATIASPTSGSYHMSGIEKISMAEGNLVQPETAVE
jgi:hypothetical protein